MLGARRHEGFRRGADRFGRCFFIGELFLLKLLRLVIVLAVYGVAAQVLRRDVGQIVPAELSDGQLANDVVDDRRRHFDVRIAGDDAVGLETREQEGIDELVERHAVLQAE